MQAVSESRLQASLKMPAPEYVYAVHSDTFPNMYKIGRTKSITSRLVQLNVSMPLSKYKLVVQYVTYQSSQAERNTHDALKQYHVSGEHYELPLEMLFAHFEAKRNEHMAGRAHVRNLVHLRRAFVMWVKSKKSSHEACNKLEPTQDQTTLNDVTVPRLAQKRKAEGMEIRDLSMNDVLAIQNVQRISSMKLQLIEKSLDIYFRMGHCSDSVRTELLSEVQPKIQELVDVRVPKQFLDVQFEDAILAARTTQIERISRIADTMNKYYGSDWAEAHPEQYKLMEQELKLHGLGFCLF